MNRIKSIDAIRGLAILGILFMNVGFHINIVTGYVGFEEAISSDRIILILQGLFIDGRFRSLFCILFGAGLAILHERASARGFAVNIYLKSRLFWLAIIGALHATFLFGGDILLFYALCGYVVIKYLDNDQKTLLVAAKHLFIAGSILSLIIGAGALYSTSSDEIMHRNSAAFLSKTAFINQSYLNFILANTGIAIFLLLISVFSYLWQALGLMVLGIYLYRSGFFERGFTPDTLGKISLAAIVSSLITISPYFLLSSIDSNIMPSLASVSAIFVSLIYAHFLIRLSLTNKRYVLKSVETSLEKCGKVALTLYISQSVAMALWFKVILPWIDPDYIQSITLVDLMLISIVFTFIQILFAKFLTHHFSQGPLEYLWRKQYEKRYQERVLKQERE
uniref:DUF418 domain-containing protein n=1 Tax=Ningiella ruwaisensis TaxID=2364274 RepID=UPI0010A0235D|nr:DUF418 domain-containing protein [Ningiella ruwaisensis]